MKDGTILILFVLGIFLVFTVSGQITGNPIFQMSPTKYKTFNPTEPQLYSEVGTTGGAFMNGIEFCSKNGFRQCVTVLEKVDFMTYSSDDCTGERTGEFTKARLKDCNYRLEDTIGRLCATSTAGTYSAKERTKYFDIVCSTI